MDYWEDERWEFEVLKFVVLQLFGNLEEGKEGSLELGFNLDININIVYYVNVVSLKKKKK